MPDRRERQVELLEVAVEVGAAAAAPSRRAPGWCRPVAARPAVVVAERRELDRRDRAVLLDDAQLADRVSPSRSTCQCSFGVGWRGCARGTAGRRTARGSRRRRGAAASAGRGRGRERVADADVGGQEDVGMAERAQRDVVGGPGADARDRQQSARRTSSRSGPRSRAMSPEASAAAQARPAPGRARAASAAPRGRAPARRRRVGEEVGQRRRRGSGSGSPYSRDEPGRGGARAGDADLLAEHGPHRELVAVDVTGHPQPRRRPRTSGPITGSPANASPTATGSQSASSSRRTRSTAPRCRAGRRAGTSPARTRSCRASVWSASSSSTVPVPCGSGRVRAYAVPVAVSTPGTARVARKSSSARPANGVRTASRSWTVPPVEPCPRRPRSCGRRRGVDLADGVVELPHAARSRPRTRRRRRPGRSSRSAPARSGRAWPGPARAARRRAPG